MKAILLAIREKAGPEKNLALLWDNASYHRAKAV